MHPCLRIEEIIDLIFDQLSAPTKYGNGFISRARTHHSELFSLAQTCRLFRDPALAYLWKTIGNVTPVIRSARRDLWEYDDLAGLVLRRPISSSDMATMKKYSQLVQHFGFYHHAPNRYNETRTMLEALHHAFSGTTLFPNLRSLAFDGKWGMHKLPLFGTQHMTLLDVLQCDSPKPLVDFSARCSGLSAARFQLLGNFKEKHFIAVLSNWQHLSELSLSYGPALILRALARYLNSLRRLRIDRLRAPAGVDFGSTVPPDSIFPVLEEISVGVFGIYDAIELIGSFPPTIKTFRSYDVTLLAAKVQQEQEWIDLLLSLRKYSRSLKKLEILESDGRVGEEDDIDDYWQVPHTNIPISNALFLAVATSFPNLTHIRFAKLGGLRVVDEDVRIFTEAMPLLEEFQAYDYLPRSTVKEPTIMSLSFFARNCPLLSSLGLEFDARADKFPTQSEMGSSLDRASSNTLTRLNVSASYIDDVELVASFIFDVFPKLQFMDWYDTSRSRNFWLGDKPDPDHAKAWSEVCCMSQSRRYNGERLAF